MRPGYLETDGGELRRLRQLKGLDLRGLSTATGISVSHLSNVERRRRDFSPPKLKLIADALGVDIAHLVKDPERRAA
jgi:transcriptional regulator with XRE-family HTH domain